MLRLIITHEGVAVKDVPVDKPELTLGRAADNDICVRDATVSARHLRLLLLDGRVAIEDLDSTNGTLLNGQPVERQTLRNGDVLRVGRHELHVVDDAEPALDETVVIAPAGSPDSQFGRMRVLSGPQIGSVVVLDKPYNTVGKPGVEVAMVAFRNQGYYLVPVALGSGSGRRLRLNGEAVGASSVRLNNGDVLEVAGMKLEFLQEHH